MKKRGFTMLELMIVVGLIPLVIAIVGKAYLEGRVAATRIEETVAINRSLALAHERIQRDLVGADAVEMGDRIEIVRAPTSVFYSVDPARGLVRTLAGRETVVARRVKSISIQPDAERGYDVTTRAERTLLPGRTLRFERTSFVARRR